MISIRQRPRIERLFDGTLPGSAALVTLVVACFYATFTIVALCLHGGNPLWFAWIGERFADLQPGGRLGYDGQFVYYIARDGLASIPHLDTPAYRLQRIGLPILGRVLSLGRVELVPWVILFVNLMAIIIITHLLAKWLRSQSLSPWFALALPLYVGTIMAYSRDLVEPLAYSLVAGGTISWLRKRQAAAVILLAFASLTKETAALFVFGLSLAEIARGKPKLSLILLASLLPAVAWQAYLYAQFKSIPLLAGPALELVPLKGVLANLSADPGRVSALLFVALPAVGLLALSLRELAREPRAHAIWLLCLQCLFVMLMPPGVYDHIMHAGRNAMGMVLAVVLSMPSLDVRLRRLVAWYSILSTCLWIVPILRWAPWLSQI